MIVLMTTAFTRPATALTYVVIPTAAVGVGVSLTAWLVMRYRLSSRIVADLAASGHHVNSGPQQSLQLAGSWLERNELTPEIMQTAARGGSHGVD